MALDRSLGAWCAAALQIRLPVNRVRGGNGVCAGSAASGRAAPTMRSRRQGGQMAQAIDRQGLDTLFVKARSLCKWVAGAEMVKVLEGVLRTRIGHLRHRSGGGPAAAYGRARRGDSSGDRGGRTAALEV